MGGQSHHRSASLATAVSGVLRALAICAPVAVLEAPAMIAQAFEPKALTADIPAEPLAQALAAFARQTGLQLVYVSGVIRDQRSHAVSAGLGANEALARIIEGTGLKFEYLTTRSIRIIAAVVGPPRQPTMKLPATEELQEVFVTANRREENLQNVPITVQVLSGEQLGELSLNTFNDVIKYTPNVTYSGNGPGTGNIFMRGLSSGGSGNQSQSTTAPFPNVALYLDDQSMQFPARNNDVYMVDMERVEVLEGPQGTLLGGGAQAGAIRYITNKPKLDVTEGNVNAGYGWTAGGNPNSNANATINLPIIADTLAIRATIFNDSRGGYISNVPGTLSFPGSPVASNGALVGSDLNTVNYTGMRLSALYKITEDWNLLIQQNYQNVNADGYFQTSTTADGTPLGKNEIVAFQPNYSKDKYESTAWTLNGKIGPYLNAVYTGSYLDRTIHGQADYSNYLRSGGGQYYACTGVGSRGLGGSTTPHTCYTPVGNWNDNTQNTHQSDEIRVSTSEDWRIRGLVGVFWEEFKIKDQMNFNYLVIPQCDAANLAVALAGGPGCVSAVGPVPGNYVTTPGTRLNSDTAFGEDVSRGYRQTAEFASVDFDIIPKVLTLTGGIRHFHYDEFEQGSEFYTSTSANNIPNGDCIATGHCGFGINLNKTEDGNKVRGNLTWHITQDILAYYTYSQGFRPGGFNRTSSQNLIPSLAGEAPFACLPPGVVIVNGAPNCASPDRTTYQFNRPFRFDSDNLISNEFGVKSEWFNHRLQANLSSYKMDWSNVQMSLFDPVHLGNITFVINGPTYEVKGVELQLVARVMEGLTVQGSSSWNSTNQTNAPCLQSNRVSAGNPTPIGQCITQVNGIPYTNPYGVLDTSPPFSPAMEFNLRARYDFVLNDYRPFAWAGANHVGSMHNEPASFPDGNSSNLCVPVPTTTLCQYTMPGYTTYDAAIGVAKNSWTAQFSASNITNVYASTNTNSYQFVKSETPLRPRVLTFLLSYSF
jgi:iron complex outermembrane receptor protein